MHGGVLLVSLLAGILVTTSATAVYNPINCAFSVWSEWMPHSNGNFEFRTRDIIRQARNGGQPCVGDRIEYRRIGTPPPSGAAYFLGKLLAGNAPSYSLGGGRSYTLSRDIALILDSGVETELFPYYKSLVSNIVGKFCGEFGTQPQDNALHIASFDNSLTVLQEFNDAQDREEMQDDVLMIDGTSYPGYSDLYSATEHVRLLFSDDNSGIRRYNNATKEVLFVIPYSEYCVRAFVRSANRLKTAAEVYVIVLGRGANEPKPTNWCLENLASDPTESHLIYLDDVTEISKMSRILLAQSPVNYFCQDNV